MIILPDLETIAKKYMLVVLYDNHFERYYLYDPAYDNHKGLSLATYYHQFYAVEMHTFNGKKIFSDKTELECELLVKFKHLKQKIIEYKKQEFMKDFAV